MSLRDPTSLRSTVPINLVGHLSTDTTMGAGMPVDSAIEVTPERLMQFTFGFAPPLIIEAAIRHGVFDALDQGAKTIENLCAETRTSPRGLRAILNALVGLELLAKDDKSGYALTAESATFLVRGKPSFHGAFFLLTSERMLSGWQKLHEIVRSGRSAMQVNREQDGVPFFLQFVEDIFPIHTPAAQRLGEALGVAKAAGPLSVLDLGAGSGVWSIALAQQSPHVRVTAVDWPGVIAITRKVASRFGVMERFRFVEGDLLEADFGSGHAIATAGHVLHSEGEERGRLLLEKIFDALAPGGTIAIAEILVDADRTAPLPALLFAVNMLVSSERGDTFSLQEIGEWLRDAGFEQIRTVEAPGLAPLIILATKPNG
jgi:ubiquinone/menaquinone biosynthesis C-methylase UbiE